MLSQNGIDYICTNFGIGNCATVTGLTWTYYVTAEEGHAESGGTAQIVARIASGLIQFIVVNGVEYTQSQLNSANGSPVTLQDAQSIANHDEPSEGQWCVGSEIPWDWKPLAMIGAGVVIVAALIVVAIKRK